MLWGFWNIPTQMCIFHQKQIIRRYITKTPRLEANKELQEIAKMIWDWRKETIQAMLDDRFRRYADFLRERNDEGKLVHTRTKSAYNSLKNNLQYLYTFKDYKDKFEIPTTTNSLESTFWRLKQMLRIHRWLTKQRKLKLIDEILWK
jgi:hypothetical protein